MSVAFDLAPGDRSWSRVAGPSSRPIRTADSFTHQEELVSRIWQHVYGLRAELIAIGRLEADPAYASQVEDHRRAAGQERSAVDELVQEYVETYGEEFVRHGEAEYSLEALGRLV